MSAAFLSGPKPRVFGHRGAAGLAPENTIPSFALALAMGADILELDVHATRDGVPVVMHDPTVDRTTNGAGAVSEYSWAELRALDAGHQFTRDGREFPYRGHGVHIPTLEAVLKRFPLARCNMEVKQESRALVEEVVQLIRRLDAEHRVLLAAEHDSIMRLLRVAAGSIATSFAAGEVADFIGRLPAGDFSTYEPKGVALQIPVRFGDIELVTAESVEAAHRCGLEVHVWTVNDPEEMQNLLHLGVDGIISDLPGLARTVVDASA
jgi:glycerophosphoryl diester phosphodiesterase